MKNWRSTIGGALSALGVFLFGAPIVMNAMSPNFPTKFMVWCMAIGFVLQGLATFCSHFFAADAKALNEVAAQVKQNSVQIADTKYAVQTGDTAGLDSKKPEEPTTKGTP